ncbi:MAG: hypothetical protein HXX09_15710 [Bacteroidetes bacterium]|nr:hypothetical protein [Bacteroidota bacterium]
MKKYLPIIVIAIYFLLQFPFLKADPDKRVDTFRHAWTDEGLYSSQIRNFVDVGKFDIKENSTFVRGPVFNIIQLPFFYILGTNLIVARLIILCWTILVLFLFLRNEKLRNFGLFMTVFALLEFHVFQFTHYSMAELLCIDFILLSLYFIISSLEEKRKGKKISLVFLSSLMLFLCYSSKVQFLYVGALAPATFFFLSLNESILNRKIKLQYFFPFLWSMLFSGLLAGIYYFLWYLPNYEFYQYVMTSETSGRFGKTIKELWQTIKFNNEHILWTGDFKFGFAHFYLILLVGFVFFIAKKKKAIHSVISIFSMVWIILELHKMPMNYLPNQYLVSLIFAIGVFIASIYAELMAYFNKFKFLIIGIALLVGLYNLKYNYGAYKVRTYQLRALNEYLNKPELKGKTIIGPWAASSSWKSKSKTLPVWYQYFNWQNPITKYKPTIVISEISEGESDNCYKNQGIDLKQISDSSKTFDVWNTQLVVYWIKKEATK